VHPREPVGRVIGEARAAEGSVQSVAVTLS
jgi:hypothetical protein